jgi:hypothetical protein
MDLAARHFGAALLAAWLAAMSDLARAQDAPAGLLGKWGPPNLPESCGTSYMTITADGAITAVSVGTRPRTIMTYTIEGSTIVVHNGDRIERTEFRVEGPVLILNPGTPEESRFTRCAS